MQQLAYTHPFGNAEEADASLIASAPLTCVPMKGASDVAGGGGSSSRLQALDAPAWERYKRMLGTQATPPQAPTLDVGSGGKISYGELKERLEAADTAHVVYLPRGRLRVLEVPPSAQRACGSSCVLASNEYDVPGAGAPLEGYCEETSTGDAGDCDGGRKGSWRLGGGEGEGGGSHGFSSVHACLSRCIETCKRCSYVSVSLQEHDCSWYAEGACDASRLKQSGLGHRTYVINDAARLSMRLASQRGGTGGAWQEAQQQPSTDNAGQAPALRSRRGRGRARGRRRRGA